MKPFFFIITTTYKRPDLLLNNIQSVENQNYVDYLHIITNDSPDCDYREVEEYIKNKKRILYRKNKDNIGKNASVNKILDYIQEHNHSNSYCIFLDDDDWFSSKALSDLETTISKNNWIVTNRSTQSQLLTSVLKHKLHYSYFWDYLITKKITGDATHCIKTNLALTGRFCPFIKNGEEWYYFMSLKNTFSYHNITTTLSKGYELSGLNNQAQLDYKKNTWVILRHSNSIKMLLYSILRLVNLIKKLYTI